MVRRVDKIRCENGQTEVACARGSDRLLFVHGHNNSLCFYNKGWRAKTPLMRCGF